MSSSNTAAPVPPYEVLISAETAKKINDYRLKLANNHACPEARRLFLKVLADHGFSEKEDKTKLDKKKLLNCSNEKFLEMLLEVKSPYCCAEREVFTRSDFLKSRKWNQEELSILGDVNITVPSKIYDNSVHNGRGIKVHNPPLDGELLFVPGALLIKDQQFITPDRLELLIGGEIDDEKFYQLYERRLLPSLIYANDKAGVGGALVTMPGMGCGNFAGEFIGKLEAKFQRALERLLETHKEKFGNIKGLVFDQNDKATCGDCDKIIGGTRFITKAGNFGVTNSLSREPGEYGAEFARCKLFSFVAWDPVSFPGNDFWLDTEWRAIKDGAVVTTGHSDGRKTDDGVKAAASDVMTAITGHPGMYDPARNRYVPNRMKQDEKSTSWNNVAEELKVTLKSVGRTRVLLPNGKFAPLDSMFQVEEGVSWVGQDNAVISSSAPTGHASSAPPEPSVVPSIDKSTSKPITQQSSQKEGRGGAS